METLPRPLKLLVAVDGSAHARRAVEHVLELVRAGLQVQCCLLNVHPPLESGHARMFVSAAELESWYREEGLKALAAAAGLLESAGLPFERHVVVGHSAETIVRFAEERGFALLVIGARGASGLSGLVLGSVAAQVLKTCILPVTVVR